MLGYKKPMGPNMLGNKMPLGGNMIGNKLALMSNLPSINKVTKDLEGEKKSGLERRIRKNMGPNALGQYA
jgi:hypothetical protein